MWLNQADVWASIAQADKNCTLFPEEIQSMRVCNLRAVPFDKKSGSVAKSKKVGKWDIAQSGLLLAVPVDHGTDEILAFVSDTFSEVLGSPRFQKFYKAGLERGQSDKKVLDALPGYWVEYCEALDTDHIKMIAHHSLDEIFLKEDIDKIMAEMSGVSLKLSMQGSYSDDAAATDAFTEFAFKP